MVDTGLSRRRIVVYLRVMTATLRIAHGARTTSGDQDTWQPIVHVSLAVVVSLGPRCIRYDVGF